MATLPGMPDFDDNEPSTLPVEPEFAPEIPPKPDVPAEPESPGEPG